jgi:hypothetical protein
MPVDAIGAGSLGPASTRRKLNIGNVARMSSLAQGRDSQGKNAITAASPSPESTASAQRSAAPSGRRGAAADQPQASAVIAETPLPRGFLRSRNASPAAVVAARSTRRERRRRGAQTRFRLSFSHEHRYNYRAA